MTREQRADVKFWREAERAFLRRRTSFTWYGICRYIDKVGVDDKRRERQLLRFRRVKSKYWFEKFHSGTIRFSDFAGHRPLRAMVCGFIAAMIETGDL